MTSLLPPKRYRIIFLLIVGAVLISYRLYERYYMQFAIDKMEQEKERFDAAFEQERKRQELSDATQRVKITDKPFELYWPRREGPIPALELKMVLTSADLHGWLSESHAEVATGSEGPREIQLVGFLPTLEGLSVRALRGSCGEKRIYHARGCSAATLFITIERDIVEGDAVALELAGLGQSAGLGSDRVKTVTQRGAFWVTDAPETGRLAFLGGDCEVRDPNVFYIDDKPISQSQNQDENPAAITWEKCYTPQASPIYQQAGASEIKRSGLWADCSKTGCDLRFLFYGRQVKVNSYAASGMYRHPQITDYPQIVTQLFFATLELLNRLSGDAHQPPSAEIKRERIMTALENCEAARQAVGPATQDLMEREDPLAEPLHTQCGYAIRLALSLLKDDPRRYSEFLLRAVHARHGFRGKWERWYVQEVIDALKSAKFEDSRQMAHALSVLSNLLPKDDPSRNEAIAEATRILEKSPQEEYEPYTAVYRELADVFQGDGYEPRHETVLERWQATLLKLKENRHPAYLPRTWEFCFAVNFWNSPNASKQTQRLKWCTEELLPKWLQDMEQTKTPTEADLYSGVGLMEWAEFVAMRENSIDEFLPDIRRIAAIVQAHSRPDGQLRRSALSYLERAEQLIAHRVELGKETQKTNSEPAGKLGDTQKTPSSGAKITKRSVKRAPRPKSPQRPTKKKR